METPGLHALCGRCQVKPPAFERTWAPFRYEAPLDYLLQQLKFHGCLDIARLLGGLMSAWLQEHLDDWPDVLIPVPLHAGRLRERGFNQSLELARLLAERLALPVDYQCCARLRLTPPQAGLVRKARIRNVKGAFEVNGRVYGHVAIIDDVMTTGSTVHELAKVLLRAGADRVDIWVCARAGHL
jgi:ComF family protein